MFGNLGMGELVIIMVIVLVLFGAKRVPEISASFGKGIREFKRNLDDVQHSITEPEMRRTASPTVTESTTVTRPPADDRPEPKRLL